MNEDKMVKCPACERELELECDDTYYWTVDTHRPVCVECSWIQEGSGDAYENPGVMMED